MGGLIVLGLSVITLLLVSLDNVIELHEVHNGKCTTEVGQEELESLKIGDYIIVRGYGGAGLSKVENIQRGFKYIKITVRYV